MEGLLGSLSSLFGGASGGGLLDFLGSEGFSNLLKGGMSIYNGMQMGDMLDFQKDLASKAEARTNTLFNQDQRDRDALNNLNFG